MHLQGTTSTGKPRSAGAGAQQLSQTFCHHRSPAAGAAQAALCQAGSRSSSLSRATHGDTATASSSGQSRSHSGAQCAQAALHALGGGSVSWHRRTLRLTQEAGGNSRRDGGEGPSRFADCGAVPRGVLYCRSARLSVRASGETAARIAEGARSGDAMNGKHGFANDDVWDTGSNGVGGHPPVALITTLGCPHCKRVQAPQPRAAPVTDVSPSIFCRRKSVQCHEKHPAALQGLLCCCAGASRCSLSIVTVPRRSLLPFKTAVSEPDSGRAQVKDALTTAKIEYEEIELSGQLKLLESIKKTTGRSTVPQVQLPTPWLLRCLRAQVPRHNWTFL